MDEQTLSVYEARAGEWRDRRGATPRDTLGSGLRAAVPAGVVVDLGCGVGRYLDQLAPAIGLDAAAAMLSLASGRGHPLVRADLESLPFATGSLAGAFARHSYLHVHRDRLGRALSELRRTLEPGGTALVTLIAGDYAGHHLPEDDFPGRYFALWTAGELARVLTAAGFADVLVEVVDHHAGGKDLHATARA